MAAPLLIAKHGADELCLLPALANRHGLVTGATGTGKTVTLQAMAQRFSSIGVPVFMADVKGDLSGVARPGGGNAKVDERLKQLGASVAFEACPVVFWDVFARDGHPVRATVSDMGPLLLSRMLDLNPTQEGVLNIVFRVADDHGLLLLDLKDLRAMLAFVADNARTIKAEYGNVSSASVGAIQRGLLALEGQGAERFFGEPMLDIADLMQTDGKGRGVVNVLAADQLMTSPKLYATFLLWMLAELFENLPEVGDPEKPRLVFFFDEAHLLFDEAPKALLDRIEQVVRLIRSKGVGVYFVTQSPLDIPESVLGQLGTRVQHALRAFTPKDKRAVDTVADTFRPNPELDTAAVITELGIGEALASTLDAKGAPTPVERILVAPPRSRIGPASAEERAAMRARSPINGRYEEMIDRESAYELLKARAEDEQHRAAAARAEQQQSRASSPPAARSRRAPGRPRDSMAEAVMKSAARSVSSAIGGAIGRRLVRGILGSLLGGR